MFLVPVNNFNLHRIKLRSLGAISIISATTLTMWAENVMEIATFIAFVKASFSSPCTLSRNLVIFVSNFRKTSLDSFAFELIKKKCKN
jgi:hypothetical protein